MTNVCRQSLYNKITNRAVIPSDAAVIIKVKEKVSSIEGMVVVGISNLFIEKLIS